MDPVCSESDDEESKSDMFTVNISYSRCEKHILKFLCEDTEWRVETRPDRGDLIWFIDAVKTDQLEMVREKSKHFSPC